MADAVRRDTGALNIIETSFILLNASALLLLRVISIEACCMLCHLNGINARATTDSDRSDWRQVVCSCTTRGQ